MNKPLNPWKLTGYKAGQNVACQVVAPEPGGYSVIITKDNLPGFLPTEQKLKPGEDVLAQFVCIHNNRILLSSRFSGAAQSQDLGTPPVQVNWSSQVDSDASEMDAAFDVWAQGTQAPLHLKRAVDLIMPPINSDATVFKMADHDLEWFFTDLEGGMRTGCVKATNEERLSRSAMLLYRGRAVGCIYGCKTMNDAQPTEQSLQLMLSDLALGSTRVEIYDLPESVTLAMSALFLGYPVQRTDDLDARAYMDYLMSWFSDKQQTACLAFNLPSKSATCLGFVHSGHFAGAFYVEDQTYKEDRNFVYELLASDQQAGVEASILPAELITNAVRFGFSLSMARQRRQQS